jgi:Amt family ammonium transporter
MAMLVTQIAAAAAAISWMVVEWIVHKKPSVLGIISGAVGGLVAITPAAGFVDPMGALCIGIAAGVICFFAATSLKKALGYDDSLDVWGVHGVGGIVGAVLTGVFAVEAIGGTAGSMGQVIKQIEGIGATVVWCGVVTFILLKVIDMVMGLRVTKEQEVEGLDISLHGESIQ